jgi:hypothetical protein
MRGTLALAEEFTPWSVDVDWETDNLNNVYVKHSINPERLEQIKREIEFADLVEDLTGKYGSEISCPFHGTDSTPSFYIYPVSRGNNGWCFGCPPGHQYWDHVRFVKELLGYSYPKAVEYLEKQYSLPFIPDVEEEIEEEEETGEVTITVEPEDLTELFVLHARREIQTNRDTEQAEEFLRIYFEAEKLVIDAKALNESNELEDPQERREEVNRMRTLAAIKLARVLGTEVVDQVVGSK